MRLQKLQFKGKKLYRVVLDTNKSSANFIETSTGVFYDPKKYEHKCIKCLEPVLWQEWVNYSRAKNTCKTCGEKATLSINNLDDGFAVETDCSISA